MYKFLTERLSEQLNESLKVAQKMYVLSKKITDEEMDFLKTLDPSSKFTYIETISRWFYNKKEELGNKYDFNSEEIQTFLSNIKSDLIYMEELENKHLLNTKVLGKSFLATGNKTYLNYYDFYKVLHDKNNTGIKYHPIITDNPDVTFITENDNYYVIKPNTYDNFVKFGKSTEWCVSMRDDISYFYNYVINDKCCFYFIINKHEPDNKSSLKNKFAVCLLSYGFECFNSADKKIDWYDIHNITGFDRDYFIYDYDSKLYTGFKTRAIAEYNKKMSEIIRNNNVKTKLITQDNSNIKFYPKRIDNKQCLVVEGDFTVTEIKLAYLERYIELFYKGYSFYLKGNIIYFNTCEKLSDKHVNILGSGNIHLYGMNSEIETIFINWKGKIYITSFGITVNIYVYNSEYVYLKNNKAFIYISNNISTLDITQNTTQKSDFVIRYNDMVNYNSLYVIEEVVVSSETKDLFGVIDKLTSRFEVNKIKTVNITGELLEQFKEYVFNISEDIEIESE